MPPVVLTASPRATRTPVPAPLNPVETGKPVAFASEPLEGIPRAPPFTTNAPTEPMLTPSAVKTPVPVTVVLGAVPVPPPIINALAAKSPLDAQAAVEVKYGIPPDVPAIVKAGVVVGLAILTIPPVQLTLVTVPLPDTDSQPTNPALL